MAKKVICDRCGARFARKDRMTRHKINSCKTVVKDIPTFNSSEFGTDKPKSKETLNRLNHFVESEKPRKIARMEQTSSELKQNILPDVLEEIVKPKSLIELYMKINHGEDDTDEDEDNNDHNEDSQESSQQDVKFLPTNRNGLEKRFKKLFHEFTKEQKLENRSELVFLLDEMLRQGYVTQEEYESFNNVLAESLENKDDKVDEQKEKDNFLKVIQSTTSFIIKNDKEELDKLIDEFKSEAGDDFIDAVLELQELVRRYFDDEATMISVLGICRSLENSSIPLSKLHRFRMLLNDIDDNRFRVQAIFRRLNEAVDESLVLNQLVREQLLSPEQYEKLKTDSDLNTIADVIKNTKVGRGLKFLPTTVDNLKTKLFGLIEDTTTMGLDAIKYELLAILDELLHKKVISEIGHTTMKNDIKEGAGGWGHWGYFM